MAIIETPGSATANSYVSEAEADLYFAESRYLEDPTEWTSLTSVQKEQVVRWATRVIDAEYQFVGLRSDPLGVDQALDWPRSFAPNPDTGEFIDSTTIPQFMKDATSEMALALFRQDRTGAAQESTSGFNKIKVDVIELGIDTDVGAQIDLIPDSVRLLLRDYLEPAGQVGFVKKLWRT